MDPLTASLIVKPVTQLVTRLVKPLYAKVEKELSTQAQVAWHRLIGSYTVYLENAVERHSHFTSVVFKNEQRKLVDYYQPLTLVNTRTEFQIKVSDYPKFEIDK